MVDDCFRDYTILILILIGDSSSTNTRTMTAEQIECLVDFFAFRDTKNFIFFWGFINQHETHDALSRARGLPWGPHEKASVQCGVHITPISSYAFMDVYGTQHNSIVNGC